jgi:chromosomal replication initiation ATPase DnaA
MSVTIGREEVFPVRIGSRFLGNFSREELREFHLLSGKLLNQSRGFLNPECIVDLVCFWCKLSREEMFSRSRTDRIAFGRHICMASMYANCGMSAIDVAAFFGGKVHTTVLWARHRVEERKSYPKDAQIIAAIEAAIEAQCKAMAQPQLNESRG